MSTLFDSQVNALRDSIPFVHPSATEFMRALSAEEGEVILRCASLPEVASRYWWTITWTDIDGQEHQAAAQTLNLCMWRAIQLHMDLASRPNGHTTKSATSDPATP